jgi:hypothetical protein|tara:strand:+ start:200 stop:619 length:420 start_codon:yes stop_codon:yes gene_type:complete
MSINKKIIKKFYNSLEKSDFDSLNELWHDDVTLTLIGSTPVSGDFKGKDSAISLIEKGVLANLQFDKVIFANEWSIIAAENDIVVGTMTLQGKSIYNKDYNQIYCQIFTIKDNKIFRLHEFFDTALVETSLYDKEYLEK